MAQILALCEWIANRHRGNSRLKCDVGESFIVNAESILRTRDALL